MSELKTQNNAAYWAEFFIETKNRMNWTLDDIDESLMLSWFANAMCAQMDFSTRNTIAIDRILEIVDKIGRECNSDYVSSSSKTVWKAACSNIKQALTKELSI